MALPKVGQGPKTGEYGVDAFRTTTKRRDRKSTRLNSSPQSNLVCRLLLEKKNSSEACTSPTLLSRARAGANARSFGRSAAAGAALLAPAGGHRVRRRRRPREGGRRQAQL